MIKVIHVEERYVRMFTDGDRSIENNRAVRKNSRKLMER